MVFAAHPDDDLIGCGGTIVKHVKLGNEVSVCYMTSGEAGSLDYSKEELAKIREEEAKNAAQVIGFHDLTFLRNPDGYLQYNEVNLKKLVELVRSKRPNLIYVHHQSDAHQDHRMTFQIVSEAVGRANAPLFQEYKGNPWSVDTVLVFEVWTPLVEFNYVEDISEFIGKKIAALREHKSQIKQLRFDEAAEGFARYRGVMTGIGIYCEVFSVIKTTEVF
jgi:LmbE family N-acetylglucosaminyl deacetylase